MVQIGCQLEAAEAYISELFQFLNGTNWIPVALGVTFDGKRFNSLMVQIG